MKKQKLIQKLVRGGFLWGFAYGDCYHLLGEKITRKEFWNDRINFCLSVTDFEKGKTVYFRRFGDGYLAALALRIILDNAQKKYQIVTRYNGECIKVSRGSNV